MKKKVVNIFHLKMTMNTPSSIFTSSTAIMASQRQATSQKFRIFQQRRRPVRRALTELGTRSANDRAINLKYADDCFTIDRKNFKKKWNFNVDTMKPEDPSPSHKWAWDLVKPKVDEEAVKEKKELKNSLFSLVSNRKQLFLETVRVSEPPQETSVPTEKSVASEPTVSSSSNAVVKPEQSTSTEQTVSSTSTEATSSSRPTETVVFPKIEATVFTKSTSSELPTVTTPHVARNNSKQLSITGKFDFHNLISLPFIDI